MSVGWPTQLASATSWFAQVAKSSQTRVAPPNMANDALSSTFSKARIQGGLRRILATHRWDNGRHAREATK